MRRLAVLMVLALPVSPLLAQEPAPSEERERLLRQAIDGVRFDRFDEALATAEEMRRLWPDDPGGALSAANVYQTMMRDYRIRDFEPDFEAMLAEALRLAEAQVRDHPTAEAFFTRGTARGYAALHKARQGGWLPAFREGLRSLRDVKRALDLDPDFVDPLLSLGLYDYWKSRRLSLGVGLFSGQRRQGIRRLETVWARGRYLRVEAAYSLQTVYILEGDDARAFAVNTWLHERFPTNPICLYYRALLLERLRQPDEGLAAWDGVLRGIERFGRTSEGFLAECYWHRARLHEARGEPARAAEALGLARFHALRRRADLELEGPLDDFDTIDREIRGMLSRYSLSQRASSISPGRLVATP